MHISIQTNMFMKQNINRVFILVLLLVQKLLIIRNIIKQYLYTFFDKIQQWVQYYTRISINTSTLHKYLRKMGMSLQKISLENLNKFF